MPRRRSWLWRAGHVHAGHRAAHEGADVQVLPLSGRRVRDDRMRRLVYPSRTRAELGSGLLHQGFSPSGRGVPAHRRGSHRRFRRRALRRRITSAPSACSCPLLVARRRSPTSSSSAPASIAARYSGPTSATRLSFVRSGTDFRPVSDFCCRSPPAGLRMQRRGPRRRGGRSRRCRSRRQSGGRAHHEREMGGSRPEVTEPGGRAGGCSARKTTARRACRRVVGRLAAPTHGRPQSPFLLRQGPAF